MPTLEIVPMAAGHVDALAAIEEANFSVPWTRGMIRQELANGLGHYFVALVNGEAAGYAGLWHVVNEGHINNIVVAEAFRRRGIGAALMGRLVAFAEDNEMIGLTLECRAGNAAALALYKRFGFAMEGVRREYYSDNKEDAIIMWKRLAQSDTEGVI